MARKRFKARSSRRIFRSIRRKSSGFGGILATVAGAGIYGAFRSKASNALAPITAKLPMGNISDEILLGALAIVGKKTIGRRVPLANQIFNGALVVESARIGEAIATGQVGIGGVSNSTSSYMLG